MEKHNAFVKTDGENLIQLAQDTYGLTEEEAVDLTTTFKSLVVEWDTLAARLSHPPARHALILEAAILEQIGQ